MDCLGPLVYVLVKVTAYIAWCGAGARRHGHADRIWLKAIVYGLVRVGMGAFLGLVVILRLVDLVGPRLGNSLLTYLVVYLPVRWLEWSLMAVLMDQEHRTTRNFLIGRSLNLRLWRLGGMAISCLADIPVIAALGGLVPVGRFMC